MTVLYEDNHLIIVNKRAGEIVQGDKTGDEPLCETVKQYIKEAYAKPGNVFLGVVHRLDRPVSGCVVFARTSKALSRLNDMFRRSDVKKTYWAIVEKRPVSNPPREGEVVSLVHYLTRNEVQNKAYAHDHEVPESKRAELRFRVLVEGDRFLLLEVELMTGRHHQIRCQLAHVGMPIRGDLKYGARRSNRDGSISLMARSVDFDHPVSHEHLHVEAPLPDDPLWEKLLLNRHNV